MRRDGAFGPGTVKRLRQVGFTPLLGAFAAIVVQPGLTIFKRNGFSEMRGASFNLDLENLAPAAAGLVLFLLAGQGQRLNAHQDRPI